MKFWQAIINERDDDYKNIYFGSHECPPRPSKEEAWDDLYEYALEKLHDFLEYKDQEDFFKEAKKSNVPTSFLRFGEDGEPEVNTDDYKICERVDHCWNLTRRGTYTNDLWTYSVREWNVESRKSSKKRKTSS
jgi:hypothetical protein